MKKRHSKFLIFTLALALVLTNLTFISFANTKSPSSSNIPGDINAMPFHICQKIKHDTKENQFKKDSNIEPLGKQDTDTTLKSGKSAKLSKSATYTYNDLNKLSYKELTDLLVTIDWFQIKDIFVYNEDTYKFYNDEARVNAIIKALEDRGATYTATDDKGIPTLVEVLRSGFYLAYYNDSLSHLYDRSYREKCIPAMISIQKNPNFKIGESGQNNVIQSLGMLIGNSACNVDVVNNCMPILNQFNSSLDANLKDYSKTNAVFQITKGIEYDLNSYLYNSNTTADKSPWFSKVDGYIDAVTNFAILTNVTDDNDWLINAGMYYCAKLSNFHSNSASIQKKLDSCLEIYPYLSIQYFDAVDFISYYFNGKLVDGTVLDINKIREEGKSHYLPNVYTFEDASMVIRTGDKVTKEKVQRLYWASKEVKAQFHRVIGNDNELEKGNPDDVLTMVLYNSPKEYKLNQPLYGYSTDNGGMYIEGDGTFFTYERTPEESIFSLEELFRHEYCHYLQGRYMVPGMWGTGDFYQGKDWRLTWFEEGSAEFFAGSTRDNDVLPRKSQVSGLSTDPAERFSTDKLLHSKYGSWDFYYYGFAFCDYMYNNRLDIFNNLVDNIISNNVSGYDSYIETLSKNTTVDQGYQTHMQNLVDKYDSLTVPLVSDDYLDTHDAIDLNKISSDIKNIAPLKNVNIVREKGEFFDTFTLTGTYTGDTSRGEAKDWEAMNNKSNEFLNSLEKLPWSGYKTVTNYFVDYKVNNNKYEFEVVFTGILPKGEVIEGDIKESEPNDNFETANSISLGKEVKGSLNKDDTNDVFSFEIKDPKTIEIVLDNIDNHGLNWLLYKSDDLNNYVAYPSIENNLLKNTYNADAGLYYLYVYSYDSLDSSYTINIK